MSEPAAKTPRTRADPLPLAVALVSERHVRDTLIECGDSVVRIAFAESADEARRLVGSSIPLVFITRRRDVATRYPYTLIREVLAMQDDLHAIVLTPTFQSARTARDRIRERRITHMCQRHMTGIARRMRELAVLRSSERRLREAAERCVEYAPSVAREAVRAAIRAGHHQISVRQLANSIGVPRKTLDRRLSRVTVLTVRQLLGWGRLIAAAIQLEASGACVSRVAADLGFPSPSALRNMTQRYAGLTPTELMKSGGVDGLIRKLAARLRERPADRRAEDREG